MKEKSNEQKKTRKIFLSLGFSGREEGVILKEIEDANKLISSKYPNEEIEFIHNYFYLGENSIDCLGEAIKKLSKCDTAYFINNWCNHKGCLVEMWVCSLYNIEHYSIEV